MTRTFAIAEPSPALPGRGALGLYVVLALIVLYLWWELAWREGGGLLSAAGRAGPHLAAGVAATIMVLARVAASGVEALAYRLWWRTRGARLPFGYFLVVVLVLSSLDRWAVGLAELTHRSPSLAPWLTPVVGPRLRGVPWPAWDPGIGTAFGGLGLLTLARIGGTAHVQATTLRRRLRGPLLVTATFWLLTRVALWWMVDLVRGMSPIR